MPKLLHPARPYKRCPGAKDKLNYPSLASRIVLLFAIVVCVLKHGLKASARLSCYLSAQGISASYNTRLWPFASKYMINKEQFYAGMRRLPAGVSIVSASDESGKPFAMTASSVTSLSDEPASLLVCVNKSAGLASVIKEGQALNVCVLKQSQEALSNACAASDKPASLFEQAVWGSDEKRGIYVQDCQARFHCRIEKVVPFATHFIVAALIEEILVSDDDAIEPLVYLNGGYCQIQKI